MSRRRTGGQVILVTSNCVADMIAHPPSMPLRERSPRLASILSAPGCSRDSPTRGTGIAPASREAQRQSVTAFHLLTALAWRGRRQLHGVLFSVGHTGKSHVEASARGA